MQRQTTIAKQENITRKWYVVDAADKPLGRLASEVAVILMGKNKPTYTPNVDCGDYVIIINASKVKLSGDKVHNKFYYTFPVIPVAFAREVLELCSKIIHAKWSKEVSGACSQKAH